ncbi:hypothetical protein BT67DRAFT_404167 [Trichocladium antarcticum]|uniref:Major facilitator superfamily (MFS) profile domain-containing protein n=1 Tax=Trichocladium antarcticum TaxID=1450529 RepID=A0AAN6UIW2_9PEZI|nr:hypothetical protein BT67DRAFT_404167 [Trichocladium antarcticum]
MDNSEISIPTVTEIELSTRPQTRDASTDLPARENSPSTRPSLAQLSHRSPSNPGSTPQDGASACDGTAQHVTGLKLLALASSITLAVFLVMLDTSIIATAIPRITDEFHSLNDVGWYISIYQLASAALQPLTGKIYQKLSTKISFLAFFAVFEIGSLICGLATSSTMLIVGRAIAGIGSAALLNGALIIIACAVPLEKRPALTGLMMGVSQLGVVVGPLLGGAFTTYTTWRWCFYINLPIGAFVAVALFVVEIPDQFQKQNPWSVLRRLPRELDLVGFALMAPAAVQLLLALQFGGDKFAWGSPTIIGLFCGAGGTFAAWFLWDWYRGDDALIPLSIIKVRAVWAGAVTQFFLLTTVYTASFFLPLYFQAAHGATAMMSGVYVLASILPQLFMAVVAGALVERTGYVIPFAMLAGTIGAVSNGLYSTFSPTTPTAQWVVYQVLNGIGRGFGMQMPVLAVQAALNPADIPIGMSVVVFTQSLGIAIVLAASDTIFQTSLVSELENKAPLADAAAILRAGATHFRDIVSYRDLPGVLVAYSVAIDRVFYLTAGLAGLAVFTSLFLGWVDVRKKQGPATDVEQSHAGSPADKH